MSQFADPEVIIPDIGMAERGPDDLPNPSSTQQDQAAQGESNISDGSGTLFTMYLERAIEEDRKMVESWKGDAEGILLFTGLFSAAVAALLAVTIPDIRQSSQDISAYYLAHLYQQSATQPNGSQPAIISSLSDPADPFSPPTLGVWVNGLWFMSLVISLTCALLATMLQQWARRYERVAHPRYTAHRRARIRAFYKHGVDQLHIPYAIEVLVGLLHVSLILFFAGLSVYLFGIHRTIFKAVTAWFGVCTIFYACITFLPVIRKDSPYSAPLSTSFSFFLTGIRYIFFRVLQRFPDIDPAKFMPFRSRDPREVHLDDFFSHSMSKTAEEYAFKMSPSIDYDSLLWTFESLDEDADLEKFFKGFPLLCDSETGKSLNVQQGFIVPYKKRLSNALIELMNRTLSSNLVPESLKQHRMIICTKAIESTSLIGPWWILRSVLLGGWHRFLGCIEFGLFLQTWKGISHKVTVFYAQCVAALTISIVRDHDERWYKLASGLLDVSRSLLDKYIANGDSILLANAIFIVRRTVQTYPGSEERHKNDIIDASSRTLETVCKLDIGRTFPELQHEFCGLWNQLVDVAQTDTCPSHVCVAKTTLKNIRKLYIALHECTTTPPTAFYTATDDHPVLDNPKSYLMCSIDSHGPSEPLPELEFDEPTPDTAGDGPSTPGVQMPIPFAYPPIRPSGVFTPSPPYHPPSPPTHYGSRYVDPSSHLGAPPADAAVSFPQPFTPPRAPNVQPGVIARSPPSQMPTIREAHLDNASTTPSSGSSSSEGHDPFPQTP